MSRYQNIDCPICQKNLDGIEPVVVCPECGAPYHLDCYKLKGECVFPDLHESGQSWAPPFVEPKVEPDEASSAPIKCNSCGTVNPSTGLFCRNCGSDLINNEAQPYNADMTTNPFGPQYTPIPDESEIEGVKAKEYKSFVGKNAEYYLHHFKQLTDTKGTAKIINWGGFLFTGWYYVFRKMYGIGIIAIIINLLLSIPNIMLTLSKLSPTIINNKDMSTLTALYMVCTLVEIVIRFLCGYFANTLYLSHSKRKILKAKKNYENNNVENAEFSAIIAKKGGVALKLITGILILYSVGNIIALIVLSF